MAETIETLAQHLVVDAIGFLKPTPLEKLGEKIYTTADVVGEIRDPATKQRLQVLPYELRYLDPDPESLRHVTEFAKKTGDYPSLSATDLRVIAAVYQLEKEHGDVDGLKKEPVITKTYSTTRKLLENPKEIVGFFLPPKENEESTVADLSSNMADLTVASGDKHEDTRTGAAEVEGPRETENVETADTQASETDNVEKTDAEATAESDHGEEDSVEGESSEEDAEEEEEEDLEGWITPDNVQHALRKMRRDEIGGADEPVKSVGVACLTADFAMQNVLLHMGLKVVSVDGVLIKRLRTYLLRCFGCFKTTSVMTTRFCPNCGNATLKKVAVTVNPETGAMEYHLSKRKKISVRGTKFSLPSAKGGKHAKNPILTADQPTPENRLSKKALQRLDVLDPNYLARDSPFLNNDVTSRSAVLGVRSIQRTDCRRNPNDWTRGRKRGGKKR